MTVPVTRNRSPWLVGKPQAAPAGRLYCFPHSGGLASEYVRWGRDLPGVEVSGVCPPGRGGRAAEEPLTAMADWVGALLDSTGFTPPYTLFGHSLGALTAFETVRGLAARGRPLPERLIVSAYPAPHLVRTAPRLHDLPDAELVAAVGGRYGGIPPEIAADPDLVALLLPAFRADFTLLETHRHRTGAPLPVPLHVFGGDADTVTPGQLEAWREHTSAEFHVHRFEGGHFYFREDPAALRDTLTALL
ncbi:thioesterase [Streptomyces sp. AV19]|uniref:thioesterase II family protein n=1 Tax=Streptomyces sp. AV19 TaxID=2793068 RepID=UPI0018FE24CA|nr:alpha/beta fold hydrolase [Streptomyces sp. AV19]MBH1934818.1 thioesterase [Streptomyces sp. AV19]MDG4530577.1 alpha/beta fold hydrolase [Streptomyces sp. AV19]